MSERDNPCRCGGTCRRCRAGNTYEEPAAPLPAPLLPSREELQPGAERAARDLLAALAEGSVVVVDEGRAMAALAEVVVLMHQGAARETARACATLIDRAAVGVKSPTVEGAMKGCAGLIRRGYGVAVPDGEEGAKQ